MEEPMQALTSVGYLADDFLKFWLHAKEEHRSKIDSIGAVLLFSLAQIVFALVWQLFTPAFTLTEEAKLSNYAFVDMVVGIFWEEVKYRIVPLGLAMLLLRGKFNKTYLFWVIGLISSLHFGIGHMGNYVNPAWYVVVSPTIGGFVKFYIAKRYGFQYAFLQHLLFNSYAWLSQS